MTKQTFANLLLAEARAGWNLGNSLDAVKRGAEPGKYILPRDDLAKEIAATAKKVLHNGSGQCIILADHSEK